MPLQYSGLYYAARSNMAANAGFAVQSEQDLLPGRHDYNQDSGHSLPAGVELMQR